MELRMVLLVGLGGFVGTVLRYMTGLIVTSNFALPGVTTFIVNIVGSFGIGLVYGLNGKYDQQILTILTVGLLGGFTTYSAFSADTMMMLKEGRYALALGYVLAMVTLCLGVAFLGMWSAKNYVG